MSSLPSFSEMVVGVKDFFEFTLLASSDCMSGTPRASCLPDMCFRRQWKRAQRHIARHPESVLESDQTRPFSLRTTALHFLCGNPRVYFDLDEPDCDEFLSESLLSTQTKPLPWWIERPRKHHPPALCWGWPCRPRATEQREIEDVVQQMIQVSHRMTAEPEPLLMKRDRWGRTPLMVLCRNQPTPSMLRLLLDHARDNQSRLELLLATDQLHRTPLHHFVASMGPIESLYLLLHYFHQAATTTNSFERNPCLVKDVDGNTPLHLAIKHIAVSQDALLLLLKYGRDALWYANHHQEYPLDCTPILFPVQMDQQSNLLELWVERNIYAIQQTFAPATCRRQESLPVHAIARVAHCCPKAFFDYACDLHPDQVCRSNPQGLLPLQIAISTRRPPGASAVGEGLALDILHRYRPAARIPFQNGRRSLHVAVEAQQSPKVVSALVSELPDMLIEVDPKTGLFPYQLAAVADNNTLDVVYSLLRSDPAVLCGVV